MRLGDERAFAEFDLGEQFQPERALNISVSRDAFCGRVENVYVAKNAAKRFINELEMLARNEATEAQLFNLSSEAPSNPLEFKMIRLDSLGHLGVTITLRQVIPAIGPVDNLRTTIAFEMDREYLNSLIIDFKKLLIS